MLVKPKSLFLSTSALALLALPVTAQGSMPRFGAIDEAFAGDGVCSDPRFEGPGMAETPSEHAIMSDAGDCVVAWEAGEITLIEVEAEVEDAIDEVMEPDTETEVDAEEVTVPDVEGTMDAADAEAAEDVVEETDIDAEGEAEPDAEDETPDGEASL
ncbi:MAG: hypothetical protein MK186_11930, partial [Henriciella sp.]|nr:hypothetical protein [Henriciella sp.]